MQRAVCWLVMLGVAVMGADARRVALVTEGSVAGPARYGLDKLAAALRGSGFEVREGAAAGADFVVRAAVRTGGAGESITIRREKNALRLSGSDANGLMYAALEVAERVTPGSDPFAQVRDVSESPYLRERGVSMYTMQRAWFEQRLYDERHWERYFDLLAASRINSFVVIFGYENGGFMAPLYPYFFNVQGFPGVEMVGMTAEAQARNVAAFRAMMRIAHQRGIRVTAGIWDHIYRGGVQGGGIPGASANAGKRVPGLVAGVTTENLAEYTKAALAEFLRVFPEVDGIQFRMHDESGLKPEEMNGFWHEVFTLVKRTRPDLQLDLRAKGLPDAVIDDALRMGLKARVSTKYWMEQMGLPFHPTHINVENQKERRHGYADLLRYPQRFKVHWQLWSGGTTRVLLWGDPEYVRRFAASARLYGGDSFEVNEMLATWMLGEEHEAKPLPLLNARYKYFDYEFERYWFFYRLFGRLTYNPQASEEVWSREFVRRFGEKAGPELMRGLQAASRVLPLIVAGAYRYQYFPTTRGWAEMNHQDSLAKFADYEGSDVMQFESARNEARRLRSSGVTAMRRPQEVAQEFARLAAEVTEHVRAAGDGRGNEFVSTVTDLKILSGLANYYAARLPAAVEYNLFRESGEAGALAAAVADERRALAAWKSMVEAAGDVYSEDLALGAHAVGFRRQWKEEYGLMQAEFAKLEAQGPKAGDAAPVAAVLGNPPAATVERVASATPGKDLRVTAVANDARSVRLRYRHLTQIEDYQTVEMQRDAKSGVWAAVIPGAFLVPEWDLMYLVEVVDARGVGRMYPDLAREDPYVIVRMRRRQE